MEGLIPIVYRAIKRTKTRSQYECLSSGGAQTYNIADFYERGYGTPDTHLYPNSDRKPVGGGANAHRRYKSVGDFSFPRDGRELDGGIVGSKQKQQQLVRFRSNRMFSCITGAT